MSSVKCTGLEIEMYKTGSAQLLSKLFCIYVYNPMCHKPSANPSHVYEIQIFESRFCRIILLRFVKCIYIMGAFCIGHVPNLNWGCATLWHYSASGDWYCK